MYKKILGFMLVGMMIGAIGCAENTAPEENRDANQAAAVSDNGTDIPNNSDEVSEPLSAEALLERDYPDYNVIKVEQYNLIGSETQDVYLLNDTTMHLGNRNEKKDLDKVLVHSDNILMPIDIWSIYMRPERIQEIQPLMELFDTWNDYFFVDDLNGNGVNEIISVRLGGSFLSLSAYEYHDDEFVNTIYKNIDRIHNMFVEEAGEFRLVFHYHHQNYGEIQVADDLLPKSEDVAYLNRLFRWNASELEYEEIETAEWLEEEYAEYLENRE